MKFDMYGFAGRERSGHARDQNAMHGIIHVRALERSRHRLVHGERERVTARGRTPGPGSMTLLAPQQRAILTA